MFLKIGNYEEKVVEWACHTLSNLSFMEKALIVIASDFIRDMYQESFVAEGFEVVTTDNGTSALQLAKEELPSVILCDVAILPPASSRHNGLAELGGFELLKALREEEKTTRIPVVIYSRMGSEEHREKAIQLEARDFIVGTSESPQQVAVRVKSYLGEQKAYMIHFIQDAQVQELAKDLGYDENIKCSTCGSGRVLYLLRDLSRGEKNNFRLSFICPRCSFGKDPDDR